MDFTTQIATELSLPAPRVANVLKLLAEGATIPFMARYRKEVTGSMDEDQLRAVRDRQDALSELTDRKSTVLRSIEEQGKLTDALRRQVEQAATLQLVED